MNPRLEAILKMLRPMRIFLSGMGILMWLGYFFLKWSSPSFLGALGFVSVYLFLSFLFLLAQTVRICREFKLSKTPLPLSRGFAIIFLYWLAGESTLQINARVESAIKEAHSQKARKNKLFSRAVAIGCELEVKDAFKREGFAAAEALVRQRQQEFDERSRRKAALWATIEKNAWYRLVDESKEGLEEIVQKAIDLSSKASQLGILEAVQEFLCNGDLTSAENAIKQEVALDKRRRVVDGFSRRIEKLREHSQYGDLCKQCNVLRDLPSSTCDRDFRIKEHALDTCVHEVEIIAQSCHKRAQG